MTDRLAALAGELHGRARTEVGDGAQFAAQLVPNTPQSVDVSAIGHEGLLAAATNPTCTPTVQSDCQYVPAQLSWVGTDRTGLGR